MILRLLQLAALVAVFALAGKLDDPTFLSVRVWAGTLLVVVALIMALSQRHGAILKHQETGAEAK